MGREGYGVRIDALAATWAGWAQIGASMSEGDWTAPSRCTGWDVVSLYAHHSLFPVALGKPTPEASPGAPVVGAADVLKGFNRPGGPAHTMARPVAEQALSQARDVDRTELAGRFGAPAIEAVSRLRQAGPDRLVGWPATEGVLPLHEAVRIVLLEATVHLLDVMRALGRDPEIPEAATAETAALLVEVAGGVAFIEAATGRAEEGLLPVLR